MNDDPDYDRYRLVGRCPCFVHVDKAHSDIAPVTTVVVPSTFTLQVLRRRKENSTRERLCTHNRGVNPALQGGILSLQ